MIEVSKVKENVAAGLISFKKINDAYVCYQKRYSPVNGKEEKPNVESLEIADLENKKSELLQLVSDLEYLINQLKSL